LEDPSNSKVHLQKRTLLQAPYKRIFEIGPGEFKISLGQESGFKVFFMPSHQCACPLASNESLITIIHQSVVPKTEMINFTERNMFNELSTRS
jgi:hypothetical protein